MEGLLAACTNHACGGKDMQAAKVAASMGDGKSHNQVRNRQKHFGGGQMDREA